MKTSNLFKQEKDRSLDKNEEMNIKLYNLEQNNIQLNRKTCYNYKIQFGGYYIWEVQANDLWNAMWGGQCITIMDVIIICNI